jgi:hypothetical protein
MSTGTSLVIDITPETVAFAKASMLPVFTA